MSDANWLNRPDHTVRWFVYAMPHNGSQEHECYVIVPGRGACYGVGLETKAEADDHANQLNAHGSSPPMIDGRHVACTVTYYSRPRLVKVSK